MIFHFKPNVYPGAFTFYFGTYVPEDIAAAYAACGFRATCGHLMHPPAAHHNGQAIYPEITAPVLWSETIPHTPYEIGTLTHELSHVVLAYINDLGVQHNDHTTEMYAYLMGVLTAAVLEKVWHDNNLDGVYDADES